MPVVEILHAKEDDALLWQRLIKGDKEAFDRIYANHIDHLLRYGASFTKDAKLIDDNIQEVFCRIWEMRSKLKHTTNVRYYLLASFRRELVKGIRQQKRNVSISSIFSDRTVKFSASIESTIIKHESDFQLEKKLNKVFGKLSARQQEIIYLKFHNDLSYDEIGELLGLDKKAVYNAISKALVTLRKGMK